jgi:flavin reductase
MSAAAHGFVSTRTRSNIPVLATDERNGMVSQQSYRDAMARLGAAVSVVTTDGPAGRCGFTASAVCSVTDDPPTILVCLNRASGLNAAFNANGVLCVNTLAAGQQELSARFAGMAAADARFAGAAWSTLATGAPVLEGAAVSFDCRLVQSTEVGTHTVLFCEVEALRSGSVRGGLIYFDREYHPIGHAF